MSTIYSSRSRMAFQGAMRQFMPGKRALHAYYSIFLTRNAYFHSIRPYSSDACVYRGFHLRAGEFLPQFFNEAGDPLSRVMVCVPGCKDNLCLVIAKSFHQWIVEVPFKDKDIWAVFSMPSQQSVDFLYVDHFAPCKRSPLYIKPSNSSRSLSASPDEKKTTRSPP